MKIKNDIIELAPNKDGVYEITQVVKKEKTKPEPKPKKVPITRQVKQQAALDGFSDAIKLLTLIKKIL